MIGIKEAMTRADSVKPDEWKTLQGEAVFARLLEDVLGVGVFPAVDDLKENGKGVRYITGLILLLRENPKRAVNLSEGEWALHPLCWPQLPKLVQYFHG